MKRTPKLETYRDEAGEYRWRLKAGNGAVIAQGESHPDRTKARRAGRGVLAAAKAAVMVDA